MTGINFEGPTPRPLERFAITMDADGFVVVDQTQDVPPGTGRVGESGELRRAVGCRSRIRTIRSHANRNET